MSGKIFLVFIIIVTFIANRYLLRINEINSDCPNLPSEPEACEFVEFFEPDCQKTNFWRKLPGTYFLLIEGSHNTRSELAMRPTSRLLLNLRDLPLNPASRYVTICRQNGNNCNSSFDDKMVAKKRKVETVMSYLLNGNKFTNVAVLLETTDHNSVWNYVAPEEDFKIGKPLRAEDLNFVRRHLVDLMVFGRLTAMQGCHWIEDLVKEWRPVKSFSMEYHVDYVAREFDVYGHNDYSLSRCQGADTFVLTPPTPGTANECSKLVTLQMRPKDAVVNYIFDHIENYNKTRLAYAFVAGRGLLGDCYPSWMSYIFGLSSTDMVRYRDKIINDYGKKNEGPPTRVKRSDPDPECSSPAKKKSHRCSQDPEIAQKLEENCIVKIIKEQDGVEATPALTDCGGGGTEAGTLVSLVEFDDSQGPHDYEADAYAQGTVSTADSIMSRAGFFGENIHDLSKTKICRKHAEQLGRGFRQYLFSTVRRQGKEATSSQKCLFPTTPLRAGHKKLVEVQRNLVLTKLHAEALFRMTGKLVPVGLPVCRRHYEVAQQYIMLYREHLNELQMENTEEGETNNPYNLREKSTVCYLEPSSQPLFCSQTSPQTSQLQMPCPVPETPLEKLRRVLNQIKGEDLISGWRYTDQYTKLSDRSKRDYKRFAKEGCSKIFFALAGDEQASLKEDVDSDTKESWNRGEEQIMNILKTASDLYVSLPSRQEKRLVLGLIGLYIPYRTIAEHISGITPYMFSKARHEARYLAAKKQTLPEAPKIRERASRDSVQLFIQWLLDNLTPMPWGEKIKKTSSSEQVALPAYMSDMLRVNLITSFKAYLTQSGQTSKQLSDWTYYKLLNTLNIRYKRSTAGLDYKTNAGLEAFEKLENIIEDMAAKAVIGSEEKKDMKKHLLQSRNYLTGDYRYDIRLSATVSDLSSTFGLSDPVNVNLRDREESEKSHEGVNQKIEIQKRILKTIHDAVDGFEFDNERQKEITLLDIRKCTNDIEEMKFHKMRAVHQNRAKTELLSEMQPNQVLLTVDFAMKWLPKAAREDMRSWFGKKGINWHITHAIRKILVPTGEQQYQYQVFQHMFVNQVPQDAKTVIAILNDTIQRLKENWDDLSEVFLRSDNAGAYHSAAIIATLPRLSGIHDLLIKRWDFSEAQDGKGPCDQAASTVKRRVRSYIDEGHNALNALQLATAAHSHGGLAAVTTIVVGSLEEKLPQIKPVIPRVTLYSNFEFSGNQVRAWRAYKVGTGVVVSVPQNSWTSSWINRDAPGYTVFTSDKSFWMPMRKQDESCLQNPNEQPVRSTDQESVRTENFDIDEFGQQDTASCLRLYSCPVDNCIKSYNRYANLERHLVLGDHVYFKESENLYDYAMHSFATISVDRVIKDALDEIPEALEREQQHSGDRSHMEMGFALRSSKAKTRFSPTVRKFDPRVLSKDMRTAIDPDTELPRFKPEEFLTWQQIGSFWSTYARRQNKREGATIDDPADTTEELNNDVYVTEENLEVEDAIVDQFTDEAMHKLQSSI